MPKETHRLTALEVKALSTPGRHADGGNLFLVISKSGGKSWSFLYRHHKRVREAGLGSLDKVSLKDEGRRRPTVARQGSRPAGGLAGGEARFGEADVRR